MKKLGIILMALVLSFGTTFAVKRILPFVGAFTPTVTPNTDDVLMLETTGDAKYKITTLDFLAPLWTGIANVDVFSGNGVIVDTDRTLDRGGLLDSPSTIDPNGHEYSVRGDAGSFEVWMETATEGGWININTNAWDVGYRAASGDKRINMGPSLSGIMIEDSRWDFGMYYLADYSVAGMQNPLWIPHWSAITGYVDSEKQSLEEVLIVGNTTEAQNIVVTNGSNIQIGSVGPTRELSKNAGNGYFEITNNDEGYVTHLFDQEYFHGQGGSFAEFRLRSSYTGGDFVEFAGANPTTPYSEVGGSSTVLPFQGLAYAADYFNAGSGNALWIPNWGSVTGHVATELASYVPLSMTGNWNTAFGRGDHSLVGYLTAETDPLWTAASGDYYTTGTSDSLFVHLTGDETIYGIKYFTGAIDVNGFASYTNTGDMGSSPEDFAHKEYVDNSAVLGDGTFFFSGSYMYVGPYNTTGSRQLGLSGTDYCKRQYTGGSYVNESCNYIF